VQIKIVTEMNKVAEDEKKQKVRERREKVKYKIQNNKIVEKKL